MKIFIVDDEDSIRNSVEQMLKEQGFSVEQFQNGKEAFNRMNHESPDLIILDWDMPVMDGITFLEQIRLSHFQTPVIFLTINEKEEYRIEGLEKGADDYICKPFSMAELKTRVKVVLRRYKSNISEEKFLRYKSLCLNQNNCTASLNQQPLSLTVTEFRLLECFCKNPGQILNRKQLLDAAYPEDKFTTDRAIDHHIKRLRKKLNQNFIKTSYGAGYIFE